MSTTVAPRSIYRPQATGDPFAMQRLLTAVRDLASARDVDAVAETVRHAARELVDADGATFVLRDNGQCFYVAEDAIEPLWRGQRFPLEACISGWSMMNQQQVVIADIYRDDRIPHDAYRPTFVQSLVMTPVRADIAIAAIGTYWADEHHATAEELELLQALADTTSVALENAQILRELEERIAERTAELEASNRDLAAFAHIAAHDLKEPLTTILGHAELVAELEQPGLSPTASHSLAAVQRQAGRMGELIDGVLAYSTAATTELHAEPIDFVALVADVQQDLDGLITRRGAKVVARPIPRGVGSRALIERVLQNLISNAINYGDPAAPVVEVDGTVENGHLRISVTDNGRGIDPAERESIFGMFRRGQASTLAGGSGIGLAFARRVAVRHGGTLTVDGSHGTGARFVLSLPLPGSAPPAD